MGLRFVRMQTLNDDIITASNKNF
ncbi:hypothetical protein [Aliivibrio finisterrensis]